MCNARFCDARLLPVSCPANTFNYVSFAEFRTNKDELLAACSALADCMQSLTKLDVDSSSVDYVAAAFDAGRRLLSLLAANDATAALAALEYRYKDHKNFKNARMEALGWLHNERAAADAVPIPLGDPLAALAMGQSAAAVLKSILDDPYGSSTAAALGLMLAAADACEQRVTAEKRLRRYPEAHTLQVQLVRAMPCAGICS